MTASRDVLGSGEGQIEYAHESAIERVDEWHPVTGEMLEALGVVLGPRHPHEPPFLGGCSDRVRANRPFGEGMAGEDADTVHLDIDGSRRSPAVEDDRSMIAEDDRRGGARQPRGEFVEYRLDRSA